VLCQAVQAYRAQVIDIRDSQRGEFRGELVSYDLFTVSEMFALGNCEVLTLTSKLENLCFMVVLCEESVVSGVGD